MPKICVFCGQAAKRKTKEHVVPKWLLELTRGGGKADLDIWTPLRADTPEIRHFAQEAFHFPACDTCNQRASGLESAAKPVVEALLQEKALSSDQFETLFDWLDKVRVGIWLAMRYLEKNPFGITPSFHISQRIGAKDRALLIYKLEDAEWGWGALGTSTPAFHIQPSCFTFFINNLYLFNASTDFLLARSFGLPYPSAAIVGERNTVEFSMVSGTRRFTSATLEFAYAFGCGEVYQPVLGSYVAMSLPPQDAAYIQRFTSHGARAAGPIFVGQKERPPQELAGSTLEWKPSFVYPREAHVHVMLRQTLHAQNSLLELYRTGNERLANDIDQAQLFNDQQIAAINRRIFR